MRRALFTIFLLLLMITAQAETITLKTGKVIQGTVLFENDDVLVIKDATGARFQYPKSDIATRTNDGEAQTSATEIEDQAADAQTTGSAKQLSLALELAGGGAILPGKSAGGLLSADLLICSHHIGAKRVMVGGMVGYHGLLKVDGKIKNGQPKIEETTYSFLPVAAVVRYPILDGKHSPMIGAAIGYGIGLSKKYLGGIFTSVDVAYRYEVNNKSSLYVGLNFQFQQAKIPTTETITVTNEDETQQSYDFRDTQGRSFLIPAVKFGIAF